MTRRALRARISGRDPFAASRTTRIGMTDRAEPCRVCGALIGDGAQVRMNGWREDGIAHLACGWEQRPELRKIYPRVESAPVPPQCDQCGDTPEDPTDLVEQLSGARVCGCCRADREERAGHANVEQELVPTAWMRRAK